LLIDLWGEIFAPCNNTGATHEYYCAENTTDPYIIDWQILEPNSIHAEYQQKKKDNLHMLTGEGRRLYSQTHGYDNEYKIQSI
jgi:hypothetical protein